MRNWNTLLPACLSLLLVLAVVPHSADAAPGRMPSMLGQPKDAAVHMLKAIGLEVRVEAVVDAKIGTVVAQRPGVGEPYVKGQEVVVGIGTAAFVQTIVPNLLGMDEAKAVAALGGAYWLERRYVRGNPANEGRVLTQSVLAGARYPHRGRLTLQILRNRPNAAAPTPPAAAGPRAVPKLTGLTVPQAEAKLRAAGLKGVLRALAGGAGASTQVLAQQPQAGVMVPAGSSVTLHYRKWPGPAAGAPPLAPPTATNLVVVPNVVGKNAIKATLTLEKAGFKVELSGAGIDVQRQTPAAGTKAAKGSRVRLRLGF